MLALQYKDMFGETPTTKSRSPLDKDDHPELDTTPLLNEEGINKYQSLIGALQWTITLGRFDVAVAVMTMSSFRVAPRQGHLDRLKRVVGYLLKMKNGFIRVRTDIPDYSEMPPMKHDWTHTVYGDTKEAIPKDLPKAMGKPVVTTTHSAGDHLYRFSRDRLSTLASCYCSYSGISFTSPDTRRMIATTQVVIRRTKYFADSLALKTTLVMPSPSRS